MMTIRKILFLLIAALASPCTIVADVPESYYGEYEIRYMVPEYPTSSSAYSELLKIDKYTNKTKRKEELEGLAVRLIYVVIYRALDLIGKEKMDLAYTNNLITAMQYFMTPEAYTRLVDNAFNYAIFNFSEKIRGDHKRLQGSIDTLKKELSVAQRFNLLDAEMDELSPKYERIVGIIKSDLNPQTVLPSKIEAKDFYVSPK